MQKKSMQNNISKIELMLFFIAIAAALTGIYYLGPSITGFVIKEFSYTEELNLVVASSGNYTLQLENAGELKSVKIDGRVTNHGKARVYLESNGVRHLLFDSAKLEQSKPTSNGSNLITAFVVKDDEKGKGNENKNETKPLQEGFGTQVTKNQTDEDKKKSNKKPKWSGDSEFIINGTTAINLSQYFTDEDGDSLLYSADKVEGIDVLINSDLAAITPKLESNFNTTITFTASDGLDIKSHAVSLFVIINVPEKIITNITEPINTEPVNSTNETINEINGTNEINATPDNATEIMPINKNVTMNKTITMSLSYKSGTIYDANDNGEESINGAVDLSVEGAKFSWDADGSKLCTMWEIYDIEEDSLTKFCNGNNDCCAFFDLAPKSANWNDIYYSVFNKDGADHDNIISAQVVYYDVNLSIDALRSEIYYSNWNNLSVKFFEDETQFFDMCLDTCALKGLNKSRYTLIFEIENDAVLRINKIKYEVLIDAVNAPPVLLRNFTAVNIPKNGNATLNLSHYFADPDGDALIYDYYKTMGIYILFDSDTAAIIPDKGTEGISFTYLIANDSENYVMSNLFMLNISVEPEPTNFTPSGTFGTFEIRGKEDNKLAVIDILGNLNIKGALIQNIEPLADPDDFALQNSSGGLNLVVTNPEGNMLIKGSLNENQSLNPTPNSFIIQSIAEENLAYVNSTGSLFLKGILKENVLFG